MGRVMQNESCFLCSEEITLQASLTSAQASLTKAMKDLSAGDAIKAASLAMK